MQVEFGLPDLESRTQIFQIHTRTMNCERDIRFELLARCGGVCPAEFCPIREFDKRSLGTPELCMSLLKAHV